MAILNKNSRVFFLVFLFSSLVFSGTNASVCSESLVVSVSKPYPGKLKVKIRSKQLAKSYKTGYTEEKIIKISKTERPPVEKYLSRKYIRHHNRQFYHKGAAFIVVKSWLENGPFDKFPERKYCMLKSDMNRIVREYRKKQDVSVIENALGYTPGTLKSLEDELFVFYIDNQNYRFQIPNGTEIGANNLWEPGGLTSGFCKEAVMINKAEADITIVFDKQLSNLQKQLRWEKLKKN